MENSNQNEPHAVSVFERIADSNLLKMFIIFVLLLIMLIPMSLIDNLVYERKEREEQVSSEISMKWGKDQVITAPVLAVPFEYIKESVQKDNNGKDVVVHTVEEDWLFLLPERNTIKTEVNPETLKRGIYSAVVYNADIDVSGNFEGYNLKEVEASTKTIQWSRAKLIFGIEDVKGLSVKPELVFGGKKYAFEVNNHTFKLFPNNLVADVPLEGVDQSKTSFSIKLQIRGSKSLNYLPLANQTHVEAKGKWGNPSFNGAYLPEDRVVTEDGFEAKWGIPSFSRKIPSQWLYSKARLYVFSGLTMSNDSYTEADTDVTVASSTEIEQASDLDMVQINFLPEVNNYQKINRVAKYGILIIVLTFASLFFTEIIKKQRVHFIQYILIGAAMVLFYSLLLAISEHLGFNWAYLIAALATVILISTFIKMITKDGKTALLFAAILSLFYSFIFILMQLRDYSLIVGTVGVFIILAVLMRVSTKVNWFRFDRK